MSDKLSTQGFLRPMINSDLESILQIRNHADVRRFMLTKHEISPEEHLSWFKRAIHDPSIELLVFEPEKKCVGFVQIKKTTFRGIVDWGFYVSPDAPKGTGRKLGLAALARAFSKDGVHKVCGQTLESNLPAIKFHKSLGFSQEGMLSDHHFDGSMFHNLILFGILKYNWIDKE